MHADEDTTLALNDGMTRIFLNTRGTNEDEVSAELVEFLHYVEASGSSKPPDSDSPRIQKIYERIKRVRANERLGGEYMQAWEETALARKDGIEIGFSKGSLLEKQNTIRRLLARNTPDADILELADCEQSLIDEVRKTLAAS